LLGGKGAIAAATICGEDEDEDKVVRQDFLYGIVEKVQVYHLFASPIFLTFP
jgi:hypothetical protein